MNIRALIAAALALSLPWAHARADEFTKIPAPAVDQADSSAANESIVLAGGCFWGVQGVFQHVKGVVGAVSGYTGGQARTAEYETVSRGDTGHAESVKVTYDPKQVTLGHLLQIYFSVAHDPTQLNKQGPDQGTQYRSAIFPTNDEQASIAKAYIAQLNEARVYHAAIVTKIEPGRTFYQAENYHQDYLTLHPKQPYIAYMDIPKVRMLEKMYPDEYRSEPVLVNQAHAAKQD